MRALIVLLVLVSGCSPTPTVCKDTCSGCCAGETCLGGQLDTQCGSSGFNCEDCTKATPVKACSAVTWIRGCHPMQVDGGAGSETVYISISYSYYAAVLHVTDGGVQTTEACAACPDPNIAFDAPKAPAQSTCQITVAMTSQKFDSIRTSLTNCATTSTGTNAFSVDCDSKCAATSDRIECVCNQAQCAGTGGAVWMTCAACSVPYGAADGYCAWSPQ